ncbi:hypothetical protein CBL_07945 [Carabus blaptoides fortunei]
MLVLVTIDTFMNRIVSPSNGKWLHIQTVSTDVVIENDKLTMLINCDFSSLNGGRLDADAVTTPTLTLSNPRTAATESCMSPSYNQDTTTTNQQRSVCECVYEWILPTYFCPA